MTDTNPTPATATAAPTSPAASAPNPAPTSDAAPNPTAPKSFLATWLLALLVGVFGVDRFYLGKVGTGILKLVTFGGFGVWWLIDLILVLAGAQRDKAGNKLVGYDEQKNIALIITGVVVVLSIIISSVNGANAGTRTPVVEVGGGATAEEPVSEEPATQVVVPDVTGMTVEAAVTALLDAGLKVSGVNEPDATVTTSSPAAGSTVDEGSAIELTVEARPQLTLAQENALEAAQQYLDFMPFSRQGLIDQLSSEYGSGYPVDVSTWAVDYLNPDWNAEAAEAAEAYLNTMAFSRDGLYEQLTSPYGGQFTPEQANAGLAAVGY